jgi:hypothetical protein
VGKLSEGCKIFLGAHPLHPQKIHLCVTLHIYNIHTQNSPTSKVEFNNGQWNGTSTQYHMIITSQLNDDDFLKCYDTYSNYINCTQKMFRSYLIDTLTLNNALISFFPKLKYIVLIVFIFLIL